jgi:hypothetical protein
VARKFKIRQLLLLILRTLAVLFLIFLFARPLLRSEESLIDYANLPKSTVVIIDNSSSMLYRDKGASFFDTAVSSAESIFTSQKDIDNAALLTTLNISDKRIPKLTFKKKELLDGLREIKLGYMQNKVFDSFKDALDVLKPSKAAVKEIYFISDMQRYGWGDESSWDNELKKAVKGNDVNVYLIDVTLRDRVDNVGIENVAVLKESRGKANVLNIFSMIRNFSKKTFENVLLKSFIGDKEAVKGFVTLKPYEAKEKNFFTPIDEAGIITGHVKLKGDNFSPDDIRYFSLKSFRLVKALVVDGDPTTQVYKSETFYLNVGLNPIKGRYSKIESRIVTYDEFTKEDILNYDVVFLCNVEGIERTKLNELKKFVQDGGGLIFFLGDKVDPQRYNEAFGELLPQKLRDVYTKTKKGKEKPFEYIAVKDYSHPILMPFEGAENGDLSAAKFYKYFVLQPSVESKGNIILEFSNGSACIVEKRYSKGRTLMFTSTADRDYNDLCIYPTYLPLLQQMTLYAADALGKEAYSELIIEDVSEFTVDEKIEDVTIIDPEGNLFYEKAVSLKDISRVKFKETYYPGFYNVYAGKALKEDIKEIDPISVFAVNVNHNESDFTKIDDEMLKKLLSENYNYIKKSGDIKDLQLKYLRGEEIWGKLLLYLILFLLLESIIASTWRKRKKIKSAKWKEEGLSF